MRTIAATILFFTTAIIIASCTKKPDTTTQATSCGLATGTSYSSLTYQSVVLNWHAVSGAISYTVQYRPVGTSTWATDVSNVDSLAESGLSATTIYEWQVQTICATGLSAFTASNIFKTDSTPPPPTINIYATYGGATHTFVSLYGLGGTSQGQLTSIGGTEAGTGNTIGLEQTYLSTEISSFACDPNQIPNKLGLVIGGVTYLNNINSSGSENRVTSVGTATINFNGTIYNVNNASDSIVITNGSYSGPYAIH